MGHLIFELCDDIQDGIKVQYFFTSIHNFDAIVIDTKSQLFLSEIILMPLCEIKGV